MEEWLFKEASDIDYTIVRPPRLLTVPISGNFLLIELSRNNLF